MAAFRLKPLTWYDLFDYSWAEHICSAVGNTIEAKAIGKRCAWQAENIRRDILGPLAFYIEENTPTTLRGRYPHLEGARALHEKAERLAELFEDEYPFSEFDAKPYSESLRTAWIEFIAYGSAHRIYHDLPKERERARSNASKPRANAAELTIERVAAFMRERGLVSLSDEQAEEVASLYPASMNGPPASVDTVKRRVRAAKKAGLIS